ncbi:MAG: hypothetical protein KJZ72_19095 [Anaerolineales bacterium]|jgi:hypothetical protein|nr:hypothetical protein [Anaerolineales bacterium]HAX69019.1 hypothetical protein [Anaerolineae bacterium]HRJ56623.1 hypothetical protein [Anaerolineales bacterium]HRK87639.1 hypothetical protein [Anaerolineales bacterium]
MSIEQTATEKKTAGSKKWLLIALGGVMLICICLVAFGVMAIPSIMRMSNEASSYSGIASEQLKSDVLSAISDAERSQNGCTTVSLFSGQMMLRPEQSGDGSWVEIWQVNACGESHLYSVSFTPDGVGGTYFSVTRTDE